MIESIVPSQISGDILIHSKGPWSKSHTGCLEKIAPKYTHLKVYNIIIIIIIIIIVIINCNNIL